MYIEKKEGELEPFDPKKIVKSCIKAGADEELAKKVAEEVASIAYIQMPTAEIRQAVIDLLKRFNPKVARAYTEYRKKR